MRSFHWFVKAALTLAMGLSGVLLQFSGFEARLDVQPEVVTRRMFYIYLAFPHCHLGNLSALGLVLSVESNEVVRRFGSNSRREEGQSDVASAENRLT